jgi:dTDP-4-amino-4,6-dideoxygalactose transaminase
LPDKVGVVVDAAHSFGGSLDGRPVGGLGDITTLSFHPEKQITSGEGGACLTDDAGLAQDMRRLRNHGMTSTAADRTGSMWQYDIDRLGYNYRLTEMQAALGLAQLSRLETVVERRNELADRYDQLLGDIPGVVLPPRRAGARSAWHLYVLEIQADEFGWSRDQVIDALRAENIQATLHYPAVHRLQLYRERGYRDGIAPVAEGLSDRLVTLPLFPGMDFSDQDDVVAALTRLAGWPASRAS